MKRFRDSKAARNVGMCAALFGVFFLSADIGAINPALATIQEAYPETSAATVSYLTTIASLAQIVSGIAFAIFGGRKIGYKPLLIIALLIFSIMGSLPAVFSSEVPFFVLLVTRFFFGFGIGLLFPAANASITQMYSTDQSKRSHMIGIGNAFFNAGTVVASPIAGVLAATRWQNVFLFYCIGFVVLLLVVLFFKEPEHPVRDKNHESKSSKLSKRAFLFLGSFLFLILFTQPVWTGLASVLFEANLGGSIGVGMLMMVMSLLMLPVSAIYGFLYKAFKDFLPSIGIFMEAIGFLLIFIGSIPGNGMALPFFIGAILVAVGLCIYTTGMPMILSLVVGPAAVAAAMGLNTTFMNVGAFLSSPYFQLVTSIFAETRYVYLVSAIGTGILAIVMIVVAMITRDNKTIQNESISNE